MSTHDRPESLRRAVEALLRQTAPPHELIIVNDGQTDVDGRLAAGCGRRGIPVTYRLLDRPSLTASRNAGIDLAAGDVVLLLDDDVLMPPDYLERLAWLYEMDRRGVIAGIGGVLMPAEAPRWTHRLWAAMAGATAENRWGPRRCVARYVRLGAKLTGQLQPARRLSGGAISLRTAVARRRPLTESFNGYCLGEDTELTFRLTQLLPLYRGPSLQLLHNSGAGGRPDLGRRGKMYAANMLAIYRQATEGGAGTALLLGYHLAGLAVMSAAWSLISRRAGNLAFAAGLVGELARQGLGRLRRITCGR